MKDVFVFEKLVDRKFERRFFSDRQKAIRLALETTKNSHLETKQKHEVMRQLETWGAGGPVGTYKNPKNDGIHLANSVLSFNLYQGKIED